MPKMYTNTENKMTAVNTAHPHPCISSYENYLAQRKTESVTFAEVQKLAGNFKKRIIDPLGRLDPQDAIGEHYVVPVSEIRAMLDSCKEAEFIHIYNAIRDTENSNGTKISFIVAILTPVVRTNVTKTITPIGAKKRAGLATTISSKSQSFNVSQTSSTVYAEAYPCPPDPRCPKG